LRLWRREIGFAYFFDPGNIHQLDRNELRLVYLSADHQGDHRYYQYQVDERRSGEGREQFVIAHKLGSLAFITMASFALLIAIVMTIIFTTFLHHPSTTTAG
jgi:hypothetical protein